MKKPRLAFGVPAYGGDVSVHHMQMWLSIGQAIEADYEREGRFDRDVTVIYADICGVARARNHLLANAMYHGAHWLVMIDADTWITGTNPGKQVLRMVHEIASNRAYDDVAIVSAPVRIRNAGGSQRIAAYVAGNLAKRANLLIKHINSDGLMFVEAVGAACMAVRLAHVMTANAQFAFTDELSEDLEFCRQIRAAGFRIALDGRMRTGHMSKPFPLYVE